MRNAIYAAGVVLVVHGATFAQAPSVQPAGSDLPAPGTRGNADNVPYIGKSDPNGNPVRLAQGDRARLELFRGEGCRPTRCPIRS